MTNLVILVGRIARDPEKPFSMRKWIESTDDDGGFVFISARYVDLSVCSQLLRLSVGRLGYEVGEVGKHGNFEAVGVPKSVREAFSTRRAEVLDAVSRMDHKRLDIHAGDRIRWTETDHKRGLINADQARITAIGRDTVSLVTSTGIAHDLPASDPMLKRLDLAYALNAHMAQGLTSDRGIAVMDSRERNLSNQQTFLVTVTRLRDGLTLFVNDASRLGAAIARNTGMKRSALETVGLLRDAAASGLMKGKPEAALQNEAPVLKV